MSEAYDIAREAIKDDDEFNKFKADLDESLQGTNLARSNNPGEPTNLQIKEYLYYYCNQDVKVMAEGFKKYRQWMLEISGIDINYDAITLASLAHKFLLKSGCYDGVYTVSGVAREFIQRAVVGGRCMTSRNDKIQVMNEEVDYKDFTSLYPSAMVKIGVAKGKPKLLQTHQLNYDFLRKCDDYFVEVRLLQPLKIDYDFPLFSTMSESGVRQFTNGFKTCVMGKIALEDLLEFYEIPVDSYYEYIQISKGYYFNEGLNYKIQEVIQTLFNTRAERKSRGCKSEQCYKLILNSSYGKTIEKEHESTRKYFSSKEDKDKYVSRNHALIKYWTCITQDPKDANSKWVVKVMKPTNDHYSMPHVGAKILEMSKRIMNKVQCLAYKIDAKIYYQDTDSILIRAADCSKLEKAYKEKYGEDLYGKGQLGKMHSDFEDPTDQDLEKVFPNLTALERSKLKKDREPICINSDFLGKKSYYMQVMHSVAGKTFTKDHIRMKGVPSRAIKYKAKQEGTTVMKLYNDLYKSRKISFSLTDVGVSMEFAKSGRIYNRNAFNREVVF